LKIGWVGIAGAISSTKINLPVVLPGAARVMRHFNLLRSQMKICRLPIRFGALCRRIRLIVDLEGFLPDIRRRQR